MPTAPFLIFLGLAAQKPLPTDFPLPTPKPARSLKEVMIEDLNDPKVQTALRITSTQTQLQNLRMSQESMRLALAMLRNSVRARETGGPVAENFNFTGTAGSYLFPFLNEPQLAKLRRLALRDTPLQALGTNEVAYALELTSGQRARIETLRTAYYAGYMKSDRPSVREFKKSMLKIAATSAALAENADDGEPTVEDVDKTQALMMELFRAFERSVRLSAKEKPLPTPDVLKHLTAIQLRRYRELSRA